jgi:hypothetical protein
MKTNRTGVTRTAAAGLLLFLVCHPLAAEEFRVESLQQPAPTESLAEAIADSLQATGIRVVGDGSTVCEIWPCKSWSVQAEFTPTPAVLYPFQPGELIGVLHFPRRGRDFRDQRMRSGLYTLRYAQQPIDGNHVGTSVTRDFLLLTKADEDTSLAAMDVETLTETSTAAARSSHPAMISLKNAVPSGAGEIQHDAQNDWWIANLKGNAQAGDEQRELVIGLVVVGHASE